MKRALTILFFLSGFIMVSCSQEVSPPADTTASPILSETSQTTPATATAKPSVAPTDVPEDTPRPTVVEAVTEITGATASATPVTPVEETTQEPPPTAEIAEGNAIPDGTVVNGQNPDGTFYRGWSTAPVTLLDYSDFL